MFAELLSQPGVAERVHLASRVGFLALHGGLEPGTAELAESAAVASGASFYALVQPDGLRWHVPAHEMTPDAAPSLAAFLGHVDVVVSLHGYGGRNRQDAVLVGGADRVQAAAVGARLRAALPDYDVVDDLERIPAELRGVHPSNPVNLTRGGGVQLELPHRVRAIGPYRDPTSRAHTAALTDALVAYGAAGA